jgi:cobalt-zinc-cadmium efflux system membrane fusion protein
MSRTRIVSGVAIALIAAVSGYVLWYWEGRPPTVGDSSATHDEHAEDEEEDFERGPNGGRLLRDGSFELEVTIVESGLPPEFRLYAYADELRLDPSDFSARIELARLGGAVDSFSFRPEGAYLRGIGPVREPHSFDVTVEATHDGRAFVWTYASHEGRTEIAARVAEAQGLAVEPAGAAVIVDTIELTGTIQADPGRISEVRSRFPGVVTNVGRSVGDVVSRGEALATVETNESLRSVAIEAPIGGLIVDRNVQNGQVTGPDPLFVISDLSEVWVYLDVFGADIDAVAAGQAVRVETLSGSSIEAQIDWISPLVAHGSQSVRARLIVANPDGDLRPGQFVRAWVEVARHPVPLAVRPEALQTFRDFDVVFARVGDVYEVRMLELGRRDANRVEVLGGLDPGEVYVTRNSYLIKADIEKSGASHDH